MTPSSRTLPPRPTNIDLRTIERRTPANLRLVGYRRQCRPMNPAEIVVEHPAFATIALRTFPRMPAAPAPSAQVLRLMLLTNDQRP
jgi:hypothetical protein